MALIGVRLTTDNGNGDEPIGELYLDRKTGNAIAKTKGADKTAEMFVADGIAIHPPNQVIAQSLGYEYGIEMPERSETKREYAATDGKQFLVAVLALFARTSYTHATPIED